MRRHWTLAFAFLLILATVLPAAAATIACAKIKDGSLVGADGQFLGEIKRGFEQLSVFNKFGIHGSKVHKTSIWDKFSPYGMIYSDLSAFALFASMPPRLLDRDGEEVGHLTRNRAFRLRMSPDELLACQAEL